MTHLHPPETLGQRLRRLRANLGYSQTQLAVRIGANCTQSRISSWEGDKSRPELDYLLPLSTELGVTIEHLLTGEATPQVGGTLTSEQIERVFATPEWQALPAPKKQALAQLFWDLDVHDYEVQGVAALLNRARPRKKE